jgi:uncharacterized protein (TIGR02058 family)
MTMKRYLVEFGVGVDIHGGDCTKAAIRAVGDAVSRCCMCGISEILQITDPATQMRLKIKIAAPFPERVDVAAVKASMSFSPADVEFEVVMGGLEVQGLHVDALGEGDRIVVGNAAITVFVDTNV